MKAKVLQASTYAKDIHGKPLTVGEVADVDPALGNAWAGIGLIEIVEHDAPVAGSGSVVQEVVEDDIDHIYTTDRDGNRVRDYQAERSARKRAASKPKPKRKRKEAESDDTDKSGTVTE